MTKKKIAISIDRDLYDWLKQQVDSEERTFASMSHALEYCVAYLKKDREFKIERKSKKSN